MTASTRLLLAFALAAGLTSGSPGHAQSAPGETSGPPLSQLLVESYDRATDTLTLVYQSGCDATDNNIYSGPLSQVSTYGWNAAQCDVGSLGRIEGYDPGSGSTFFVVAGHRDTVEGSYGTRSSAVGPLERAPYTSNSCGQIQDLTTSCSSTPVGATCGSSLDCPRRQDCVETATGPPQCECLAPFDGPYCESCAPGYGGPDCRECEPGYYSNRFEFETGDSVPQDPTSPLTLLCRPDVTESCSGITCSGHGTCELIGRDAVCACEEGYAGGECSECAPDYEVDPASGVCVLGAACRAAKCGDRGDCVATPFGDVTCSCDSGSSAVDCGGPEIEITTASERSSLYAGETIVLDAQGGSAPYSWQVVEGPARVTSCPPGACPPDSVMLTLLPPAGGFTELELIRVSLSDTLGNQTIDDFVALPPSCLPFTGDVKPELLPFNSAMCRYMRARGIRAGALAISRGGKQVGAHGYGYRDAGLDADPFVNAGEGPGPLVQPNSPFRLASVSKPLIAAAVRGAATDAGVDIGSSSQANRAATWVQNSIGFSLTGGAPTFNYNLDQPLTTDDRWASISIRDLLNHHAGFDRGVVPPSTTGQPGWNDELLPFTEDLIDPAQLQTARWGARSTDMVISSMYITAALQLSFDPRPTAEQLIRFAAGTMLNYNPGGNVAGVNSNYSNLGYILLGRVLEGLSGETFDPDEPGVPDGWGAVAPLLDDYLCQASGIHSGIYPGDEFNPQPLEPYYRDLDWQGNQLMAWNMAEGSTKIRFNAGLDQWQFCQSNCPDNGAVWNDQLNTPRAYGGVWLASANSAGGLVGTAPALLRFARNHRVKIGAPGDATSAGIGSPLPAPGAHATSSDHGGANDGVLTELWQMAGERLNRVPFDGASWKSDPSAPVDLDDDGKVIVAEPLIAGTCELPSDVVVAALFNQRQDQRAPNGNRSSESTSDPVKVYFRIKDMLAAAACEVDAEGWPVISDWEPGVALPCP